MGNKADEKPFHFVLQTNPTTTVRQRELGDSDRRAHAAKVGYNRRRTKATFFDAEASSGKDRLDGKVISKSNSSFSSRQATSTPESTGASENYQGEVLEARALSRYLKGNSDPFECYAITITPRMNQALTFMRDVVFPALPYTPFYRRVYRVPPGGLASQGFEFATASLRDEGVGLACIASHVIGLSAFLQPSPEFDATQLARAMTLKSTKILRKNLMMNESDSDVITDTTLIHHVFWLCRASIDFDDLEAFEFHAKTLTRSVAKGFQDGIVEPFIVIQAASLDIYIAVKYMRRTFFDYEWFGKAFNKYWLAVEPHLPPVPAAIVTKLHPCVKNKMLRQCFFEFRKACSYADSPRPDSSWGPPAQKRMTFGWFTTVSIYGLGQTIKVYHDLMDARGPNFSEGTIGDVTEAALALGLLYFHRAAGHGVSINGVDFRDASQYILSHLRQVLKVLFRNRKKDSLEEFEDAYLWLLYLGAFNEKSGIASSPGPAPTWFQSQLVTWAIETGKTSWNDLHSTLERFLTNDWSLPVGSEWFEQLVEELRDNLPLDTNRV